MAHPQKALMDRSLDPHEPALSTSKSPPPSSLAYKMRMLPLHLYPSLAPPSSTSTQISTTPARSLYPDRPLADASSSGSLTERPARHDRVNSTTITPSDVTKWMEKGTFGSQTPDDLELGIETHVVCMLKGEVQVGSAANEHETGNRADHATGVEATKKLKQYRKSDSLRQISKENGIDQAPQAPALDGHEAADLVVEGVVGD